MAAPPPAAPHIRVIVVTDSNGKERKLFIPASLDLNRPKRPRTTFTAKQLQVLELEFVQNRFISETRRRALSLALSLTETQIKVWFQNRRTKARRMQQHWQQQKEPARVPRVQEQIWSSPPPPTTRETSLSFTKSEVPHQSGCTCAQIDCCKEFLYQPPLFNNVHGHLVTWPTSA